MGLKAGRVPAAIQSWLVHSLGDHFSFYVNLGVMSDCLAEQRCNDSRVWLKPRSLGVAPSSVLLHPGAAVVEQAKTGPAVPVGHATDGDSGLLQHLVQRRFLNGCRRDALLVGQRLQLPERRAEKKVRIWKTVGLEDFAVYNSSSSGTKESAESSQTVKVHLQI